LVYSGIDVRRTPEGEYVFLEGNPCPMFIHFERQTGYPISDRLADLLTGVIKPSG
jgi:glutathione synthase/RimK-type ligase-like ATP-grasp enzyme